MLEMMGYANFDHFMHVASMFSQSNVDSIDLTPYWNYGGRIKAKGLGDDP